jgi:hypothetical protein
MDSPSHPPRPQHLRLPVWDPAAVLSIALFRRDDQSGGRKVAEGQGVQGRSGAGEKRGHCLV